MLKKKYFMLLLLLLFVLSLGTLSNCYAFTWTDLVDHCKNIDNSLVTNTIAKNQANKIVQYQETYLHLIDTNGYDIDDYNTFLAFQERGSNTNKLIITNKTLNVEFNKRISGVTYQSYISNTNPSIIINLDNNTFSYDTGNIFYGQLAMVGLVENMQNFGSNTDHFLNNQYIYSVLLTTTLRGESPYLFAERTCWLFFV